MRNPFEKFDLPRYSIEGTTPTTPAIDFEALEQQLRILEQDPRLTREAIHKRFDEFQTTILKKARRAHKDPHAIESFIEQRIKTALERIFKRVKTETTIAEETENIFDISAIPDIHTYIKEKGIRILSPSSSEEQDGLGFHDPVTGTIAINENAINTPLKDVLLIVSHGCFPASYQAFVHETIHKHQDPTNPLQKRTERLSLFLAGYGVAALSIAFASSTKEQAIAPEVALLATLIVSILRLPPIAHPDRLAIREWQANSAQFRYSPNPKNSSATHLIRTLAQPEVYDFTPRQLDQCIAASIDMDRLRALGVPHAKIAALVTHARWDEKHLAYNTLFNEVERERKKRNLSLEEVDTLLDARYFQRRIDQSKLKRIAMEELHAEIRGSA